MREFEEVLAAMPRLDAFADASQSGCCFGKLCHFNTAADPSLDKCASCGCEHHHLCAKENRWLKWIGDKSIEGRKCFDCWLLEAQLTLDGSGTPVTAQEMRGGWSSRRGIGESGWVCGLTWGGIWIPGRELSVVDPTN